MVGETGFRSSMKGNCVARALYENVAESPDELAFRKEDLLTVLEQNTAGLEGWWLCSLRGRQGICPGNRLRIIPGCYDTGSGFTISPRSLSSGSFSSVQQDEIAQKRPQPSALQPPKKVVTPRRVGDVFTYDSPRVPPSNFDYDVPVLRHSDDKNDLLDCSRLSRSSSLRYDTPRPLLRSSLEQYDLPRPQNSPYRPQSPRPLYDTPRPSSHEQQHYDTPRPFDKIADPRSGSPLPRTLIKGVRTGPTHYRNQNEFVENGQQEYDIPKHIFPQTEVEVHVQSDRSSNTSLMSCDSQLSNSSSASSLQASESLSLSSIGGGSSNRSSLESHDVYDIPPEPRRCVNQLQNQRPKLPPRQIERQKNKEDALEQSCSKSTDAVYDIPPQVSRDAIDGQHCSSDIIMKNNRLSSSSDSSGTDPELHFKNKELPLELDSAKDTLAKLESELLRTAEKLSALKTLSKITCDNQIEEVRLLVYRLKESLGQLLKFARGSVGNAFKCGEQKMAKKLSRLVEPLEPANIVVDDAWKKLQSLQMSLPTSKSIAQEQLKQILCVVASLCENVKKLTVAIHGHSSLLFKKSATIETTQKTILSDEEKTPVQERPLPELPTTTSKAPRDETKAWLEDYDYVNLETKQIQCEAREILDVLPVQLRKSYDNLLKQCHLNVDNNFKKDLENVNEENNATKRNNNQSLNENDKQVIDFYSVQSKVHLQNLNAAIDAFLLTIENNQPPKVFIAHSKFVILSAHKLVYIGDTVHRNVVNCSVKSSVLKRSNALCAAMKNTVASAKSAALHFPSVTAVQAMVDAFVSISTLANDLKRAICME